MSLRRPDHNLDFFLKRIHEVPRLSVERPFYRLIPAARAHSIAETGGSFLYGGRYNVSRVFGALYMSEEVDGAWQELLGQYQGRVEFMPDYVSATFQIRLQKVLNLTDAHNRRRLDLTLEDLTDPVDRATPQAVGMAAWLSGVEGILFPSSPQPHRTNMAVFVDKLTSGSSVTHAPPVPFIPHA